LDVIKRRQELINSLSKEDKVAIAISVIDEEIKLLEEIRDKTQEFQSRTTISQMIYELMSAKDHL